MARIFMAIFSTMLQLQLELYIFSQRLFVNKQLLQEENIVLQFLEG